MASFRLTIISGILIAVFALTWSDSISSTSEARYLECRQRAQEGRLEYESCMARVLSKGAINETRGTDGDEKCKNCRHFCRKQNEIIGCARQIANGTTTLSNKSVYMVPFLRNIFEETIAAICENDAEILKALADKENTPCIDSHWEPCDSVLMVSGDFNKVFFCDSTDPANNTFTPEFVCQKIHTALECLKRNSDQCSAGLRESISLLLSKLRNSVSCSKYY